MFLEAHNISADVVVVKGMVFMTGAMLFVVVVEVLACLPFKRLLGVFPSGFGVVQLIEN